jgi:hypothetical protein
MNRKLQLAAAIMLCSAAVSLIWIVARADLALAAPTPSATPTKTPTPTPVPTNWKTCCDGTAGNMALCPNLALNYPCSKYPGQYCKSKANPSYSVFCPGAVK